MAMIKNETAYVKDCLRRFLYSESGAWEWDDFISTPINDNFLNAVRLVCLHIPKQFPPDDKIGSYCNKNGIELLIKIEESLGS
jgi:hypothetical protein